MPLPDICRWPRPAPASSQTEGCQGLTARPRLRLAGSAALWLKSRCQSCPSKSPRACARASRPYSLSLASQGLQEIHHRGDFLFGQYPVPSERRHHGQWIAQGFVVENGDEIVAIGILAFDVDQFGPDGAWKVATPDDVAGQAIALAAVEGELSAFVRGGLRMRGACGSESADQKRQRKRRKHRGPGREFLGHGRFRSFYFGCMASSGPVVRGVRSLPSAVDDILTSAASTHAFMHGFAIVSGRGSVHMKLSRLRILIFGKLLRSATNSLGTRSFRFRI